MMIHGNIRTDHWSDGMTHLLPIVPPHRYPREQLWPNDIRICGQDLLVRIVSSDTELSSWNDVRCWIVLSKWQSNNDFTVIKTAKQSKIFHTPKIIKTNSQIEARGYTWWLPSSNKIDHVIIYMSDYLGFGCGSNYWDKSIDLRL